MEEKLGNDGTETRHAFDGDIISYPRSILMNKIFICTCRTLNVAQGIQLCAQRIICHLRWPSCIRLGPHLGNVRRTGSWSAPRLPIACNTMKYSTLHVCNVCCLIGGRMPHGTATFLDGHLSTRPLPLSYTGD